MASETGLETSLGSLRFIVLASYVQNSSVIYSLLDTSFNEWLTTVCQQNNIVMYVTSCSAHLLSESTVETLATF